MVHDDCFKYLFDLRNKLDGIIISECKVLILSNCEGVINEDWN